MDRESKEQPRWIAGVAPPPELRHLSMTALFEKECREQPAVLAELLRAYQTGHSIRSQLQALQASTRHAGSTGPILFVGMGASYCSSISATTWLQANGCSAFSVDAGEWLHYAAPVWHQPALSVLVTTSGESAELVELFKKNPGNPSALICNNEKSTCWSLAANKLPILAGPEYGNATKTYTNATAAGIILASTLLNKEWSSDAKHTLDTYLAVLDRIFSLRQQLAEFSQGAATLEIIGRGPCQGSALMGALCIREMAGLRAVGHSGAGFRHGPLLDVDSSHLAIIFALGRAARLGVKLAEDCNQRGGKVILVSAEPHKPADKLLPIQIAPVPEPWECLTSVLIPQAITLAFIEKHGAKLAPRFQYGAMIE